MFEWIFHIYCPPKNPPHYISQVKMNYRILDKSNRLLRKYNKIYPDA